MIWLTGYSRTLFADNLGRHFIAVSCRQKHLDNSKAATAAKVRVVIESSDSTEQWGRVGVSDNIIDASWQALVDSFEYKLLREEDQA